MLTNVSEISFARRRAVLLYDQQVGHSAFSTNSIMRWLPDVYTQISYCIEKRAGII